MKVGRRSKAAKVEAKGIFVGARVIRGPDWDWGDQDGEYKGVSYTENTKALGLSWWLSELMYIDWAAVQTWPGLWLADHLVLNSC